MSNLMGLLSAARASVPQHTFTEFTPIEYLAIDIASNYGLDKKDYAERIDWTLSYEPQLMKMVAQMEADPTATNAFLEEADEPALFFAGCLALRDAREGKPSGYPVSFDAASSGLQILAILSGCRKSASICGVVPTGHRADAYTHCYGAMCALIGDSEKISRPDLKRAIMTSLYSSTAVPKEVFGEGPLLQAFYETINAEAPGAWALNKALQKLWNPSALEHSWLLPDNFHAVVKVVDRAKATVHFDNCPYEVTYKVNQPMAESRSISPNIVHSVDGYIVREMHRRCSFDLSQMEKVLRIIKHHHEGRSLGTSDNQLEHHDVLHLLAREAASGVLSARILDVLDWDNAGHLLPRHWAKLETMIKAMPETPFDILSVHDCFRCHPNHANDMRRQYNRILADLAQGTVLEDIASAVTGSHVTVNGREDFSKEILEADYALT